MLWLISQNLSQLHTLWQRSGKAWTESYCGHFFFFFGYATEREYKGKPKREIFSALNICLGRDCTFAKETVSASRGARSCYYKNKRERKIESLKESLPIWVLLCLPSIMRFCCGPAGMQELQGGRGFAGKQSWAQYGPNGCRTHSAASCWYMSHWSWPMAPCTGQPSFLFFFFFFTIWTAVGFGVCGSDLLPLSTWAATALEPNLMCFPWPFCQAVTVGNLFHFVQGPPVLEVVRLSACHKVMSAAVSGLCYWPNVQNWANHIISLHFTISF